MAFTLPELPYGMDQLAPHISKETLEFHYGKHHRSYVEKLNGMVEGKDWAKMSIEEVIRATKEGPVFNNAAQVFNHTFYWNCLSPNGGGAPKGTLANEIKSNFGSFDDFKKKFTEASVGLFGSGWSWLVKTPAGKLEITQTSNAGTPITGSNKPLMTCDVWEHAYYIDYRNARPKYMEGFWSLVNWEYVESQL